MRKTVIMILLVVCIPVLFATVFSDSMTGMVANEMATLRQERIQLYLNFPIPDHNPALKRHAERARNALRMSAQFGYYHYEGITQGDLYFASERELIDDLLVLACLKESDLSDGRFVSSGGMSVTADADVTSIGRVPCDPGLAAHAEMTIRQVLAQDYRLVLHTLDYSSCPGSAHETLTRAKNNIENDNIDAALNNLHVAWRNMVYC